MFKFFILCCLSASQAVEFQVINRLDSTISVGILGNPGQTNLENGGFVLDAGQMRNISAPDNWAGRFWARTGCNFDSNGAGTCETGDCGGKLECAGSGGQPPVSLAEFTLQGEGGLDYYDISLVNGFNVPMNIEPVGGNGDGGQYSCTKASCPTQLNNECPSELQLVGSTGTQAVEFQITNKEIGPIWVGIQGNAEKSPLSNGGFILGAGATTSVQAPDNWAGRFWARTYCDPNTKHCLTGDCGNRVECAGNGGAPPASLAEITLKGYGNVDYYDISLVDGFNLAISIEPVGGHGDGGQYSCTKASCPLHLNDECPSELKLVSPQYGTVGCKSACLSFNTDQYCCRGAYGTPDRCQASTWPVNYPAFFKSRCPDAYSYAYDDHKSTFTCSAQKYEIVFGI